MRGQQRLVAAVGAGGLLIAHALDEARALPGVHEEGEVVEKAGGPVLWLVLAGWLLGLAVANVARRKPRRNPSTRRLVVILTLHSAGLLVAVEVGARLAAGLEPLEPEELFPLSAAVVVQLFIAVVVALLLALPGVLLARWARPPLVAVDVPVITLPSSAAPAPARSAARYTRYLGRAPPRSSSAIH